MLSAEQQQQQNNNKERVSEVEKQKRGDIQRIEGKHKMLDQPFLPCRLRDFSTNHIFPGQPPRS